MCHSSGQLTKEEMEEKIYDSEAAGIPTLTQAIFSYFIVLLLVQPIR